MMQTVLPRRPLGRTGLSVSVIGYGTWGIGGLSSGQTSYGATDDRQSLNALAAAIDDGVNFLDTAHAYGDGHAEILVGQIAKGRRDDLVIATKAGLKTFDSPPDYTPSSIRKSLHESLRRMNINAVDLLLLHSPPESELLPSSPSLQTLVDLQREGLTRSFGVSLKSPQQGMALLQAMDIPVLQINFNMMDVRAETCGLLALAQERQTGLIARTPLCFGFLSGKIDETTAFLPGDHRAAWSTPQRAAWGRGARLLNAAVPPAQGQTQAQVALRFCITPSSISTVIPGPLSTREALENTATGRLG
ncbi:MAG: aldo/keto reductase, partial [Rhodospirillaceae bacterium]|nr:aldo/keto reductase [Rhodospirillaceae bacterium]